MKRIILSFGMLVLFLISSAYAGQDAESVKIITLDNRARLCPEPMCGQGEEISRIKTGSILKIKETTTKKNANVDR